MEINPGIRNLVAWLNNHGWETIDSGDGMTNITAGMAGALEYPHVMMRCATPEDAIASSRALMEALQMRGWLPEKARIEVNYSPVDECAFVFLFDLLDSDIG